MHNHRPKLCWQSVATLSVACVLAAVPVLGASASAAHKAEHFSLITTDPSSPTPQFSAVASGVFTAGGTATKNGSAVVMTFPAGTVTLQGKPGKTNTHATADCLQVKDTSGEFTVQSGTGAYQGITGSGTSSTHAVAVESKTGSTCASQFDAIQVVVNAIGSVSLP
jgi:hypothetical protein